MSGLIGVGVVLVLAILFGWLATRAWRLRNTAARLVAGLIATLVTLVFGQDPYGRNIDPALMPWKDIGAAYTDDELRVIYAFLHGLT